MKGLVNPIRVHILLVRLDKVGTLPSRRVKMFNGGGARTCVKYD